MKDAEDAFVLQTSQSALLGGSNPKLNHPLQVPGAKPELGEQPSCPGEAESEEALSQKDESEIGDSISQLNLKQ